jgi:hypothetical protein
VLELGPHSFPPPARAHARRTTSASRRQGAQARGRLRFSQCWVCSGYSTARQPVWPACMPGCAPSANGCVR